jgi:hypothetical protein
VISMPFAFAPTGVPGSGSVVARPYAVPCPSLLRPITGAWGTGAPVAGSPVAGGPVAGGPVAGGPVAGGPVAGGMARLRGTAVPCTAQHDPNAQNDGTTLGFHPSGRPLS